MPKALKIALWMVGGIVGVLVLTVAVLFFVDANAYKARLEAAASHGTGMKVEIAGNISLGIFPGLYVTLEDVQIHNRGIDVGAAQYAKVGIEILPLLQKKVRISTMTLKNAKLYIERDRGGVLNLENTEKPKGAPRTLDLARISASDSTVTYADKKSGKSIQAQNCKLEASRLRLTGVSGQDLMKNTELTANLSCERVSNKDYAVSDLKLTATGEKGVFNLKPLSLKIFSGQGSGQVRADFSDPEPSWKIEYRLAGFRIEEVLATAKSAPLLKGAMDFSMTLSLQGKNRKSMQQTVHGEAMLRGENLTLVGRDLDRELALYDSTQKFNLVDLGALYFAGPIGLAITKGYDYANLFKGKGGNSQIHKLISKWKIEHGVAEALDVAIATNENRVALQGGLDFPNEQYQHVTVALVDAKGCTLIRQKIRGPFKKPVVENPNIIKALTGPVRKLLTKTKEAFTGKQCELFYSGSLVTAGQ